jgi:predicted permease
VTGAITSKLSMPAAAVTTVLVVQYELDKTMAGNVVVLTTILSPLTLTLLIAYLLAAWFRDSIQPISQDCFER